MPMVAARRERFAPAPSTAASGERHAHRADGDADLTPQFADVGRHYGPFDLVMLEVGAFHPRGAPSTSAPRTR